ncbi:MAG: DUF2254 domain-containing protein [Alphaproteobacteria bacterium]|nr:MAG: DUF2254 domain-containing protein [Alphaproteobacteria bacterium]
MPWSSWYRLKSYARSSLWIVPFIAIPLGLIAARMVNWLDAWLGWPWLGLTGSGAQALLQAVITATLSFVVFTFGSLLVAIQVASGQLTSRIIATTLLRNDVVRYTVGLLVLTMVFALSSLDRMSETVPQLAIFIAGALDILSFAAFFYLIDYAGRLLRPISVIGRVAEAGLQVIESVYPAPAAPPPATPRAIRLGAPDRVVRHCGKSEIVLALRLPILIAEAERTDGVIEFVPQVGDFVASDEPMFLLYGGASGVDARRLCAAVAFGPERTLEQDPTFAFRIVIDIALRALSPAVNDPTTAVLCLDQLHRLLRAVGKRNLGVDELPGSGSREVRVIWRTAHWEDFVDLTFSEIRHYGADNLQVVRRLRALIDNLVETLPGYRHNALHQQLALLDREIEKRFANSEEVALAHIADTQGLGGRSRQATPLGPQLGRPAATARPSSATG